MLGVGGVSVRPASLGGGSWGPEPIATSLAWSGGRRPPLACAGRQGGAHMHRHTCVTTGTGAGGEIGEWDSRNTRACCARRQLAIHMPRAKEPKGPLVGGAAAVPLDDPFLRRRTHVGRLTQQPQRQQASCLLSCVPTPRPSLEDWKHAGKQAAAKGASTCWSC